MVFHCGYNLHFPNDYWASFQMLLGYLYTFFWEISIRNLCHFIIWLFFIVVFKNSLHIPYILYMLIYFQGFYIEAFIRYMIFKCFLPFCALFYYFLDSVAQSKIFKLWWSIIATSFILYAFIVISKKWLLNSR